MIEKQSEWIKKHILIIAASAPLIAFVLYFVLFKGNTDLEYIKEGNAISIHMESATGSRSDVIPLVAGDSIDFSISYTSGDVDISIADSNGSVVYRGHNPILDRFRVNIKRDDNYTIALTAKDARCTILLEIKKQGYYLDSVVG